MKDIKDYKIIDFHVHVFADKIAAKATKATCDYYRVPSDAPSGNLQELYKSIEGFNVQYMVVHSTATKESQVTPINDFLAGLQDSRFIKFGTMHPDFQGDIGKELKRIKDMGLRGLKLHPDFQHFYADSKEAYKIYDAAQELSLPVLFHVGDVNYDYSHPRRIAQIAADFKQLKIIGAHMGGREQWQEAALELADKENVMFDTSSAIEMLGARRANHLIKIYGHKRVMFATDFPMANMERELKRFMYIDITEQEREDILYNNAARLLNL